MQTSGTAGGAHRAPAAGIGRRRLTGGILVLALGLGSLGAAVLALPGHVSTGQAGVSAHQSTGDRAHPASIHAAVSKTKPKPWMY